MTRFYRRTAAPLAGLLLVGLSGTAGAASPAPTAAPASAHEPDRSAPAALSVQPGTVHLVGPHSSRQIVVTGRYADGTIRDLTRQVAYEPIDRDVVSVTADGFATPKKNGQTTILVKIGTVSAFVDASVAGFERPNAASFRNDVIPALNVGGCNQGACHGTPSGKNGFKLSLRGFDPAADFTVLTRELQGRRTDRNRPRNSLVLQKALGQIPHEGGKRFEDGDEALKAFVRWLDEGSKDDTADLPTLKRVEVTPGSRVLHRSPRQQLAVTAYFSDGSVRDVTRFSNFSTSDTSIAKVSGTGYVEFLRPSEVAVVVRFLEELVPIRLTYLEPRSDAKWIDPPENNYVDKHVFAKLKLLGLPPADLATDEVYLRRVYLDVIGAIPTPEEARAFLDDKSPNKRQKLVDSLLKRPEYLDFWTLKWMDLLNANKQQIQIKGTYTLNRWLRTNVEKNTPVDQIVRELLTSSGSTFFNPAANFYRNDRGTRSPEDTAQNVGQLFLGVRMSCAKCHNHPFERWTQDDYYGLAAFFARVASEVDPHNPNVNRFNQHALVISVDRGGEVLHLRTGQVQPPRFPGGETPEIADGTDRRVVFADWLTSTKNPFFAKAFVNRVWFHLLGRGIVDPVDDFRDSNPPASQELLDALAADFVAHKYDIRHLIRTIIASRTYQLSAVGEVGGPDGERFFARAVTRLHTAEQTLDALSDATGSPEQFKQTIPGGAGGLVDLPLGTKATQIIDGSTVIHPFLISFGKPIRETVCECERSTESSLGHALQIINGPSVKSKISAKDNRIGKLLVEGKPETEIVSTLFLATLSRYSTDAESKAILAHVASKGDKRKAWEDVQWALLNAKEFLFRH